MKKSTGEPSIQNLVDTYSGKSERELLGALQGMNSEDRATMRAFAEELKPMLNDAQKQKLYAVLRQLGGQ